MGLKSDFGGHHHESIGDLYYYVQWFCFLPTPPLSSIPLQLVFKNNTCLIGGEKATSGYGSKCNTKTSSVEVGKNVISSKSGPLKICNGELLKEALRQHPERDPGTVELPAFPPEEEILALMKKLLQFTS